MTNAYGYGRDDISGLAELVRSRAALPFDVFGTADLRLSMIAFGVPACNTAWTVCPAGRAE